MCAGSISAGACRGHLQGAPTSPAVEALHASLRSHVPLVEMEQLGMRGGDNWLRRLACEASSAALFLYG